MRSDMDKLAERYGLRVKWTKGPTHSRDAEGWEHHAGNVRVSYSDPTGKHHQLTIPYRVGMGINPDEVTPADVLSSLILDASAAQYDFPEFCGEFGYDDDSIRALRAWEACREIAPRVNAFFYSEDMRTAFESAEH